MPGILTKALIRIGSVNALLWMHLQIAIVCVLAVKLNGSQSGSESATRTNTCGFSVCADMVSDKSLFFFHLITSEFALKRKKIIVSLRNLKCLYLLSQVFQVLEA